jgi:hypothetical protein|tara:strand:+ start:1400 stop:2809 length:1410 start_codon:yes stop_codon:yes gene_type:complete
MTSTIKVDNIQDQDGNNIINENSNTITIGASGDTVALASGASQTGFGRTGTVNWQTGSIKTATFTAVNGEGYFCNTSGGTFTVNLPAGSAGAIVSVSDYTRTFQTNNLTVSPNGSEKIGGVAADATLSTEGQTATFVYVDGTEGWINTQETSNSVTGRGFITATGGTITTSGDFKIHTFNSPGTFCVSAISSVTAENTISYLVVAGGGSGGNGGGSSGGSGAAGAGGGAGGYRESKSPVDSYTSSPIVGSAAVAITAQAYPITVGAGGATSPAGGGVSNPGSNSIFSTITSAGGGGGGVRQSCVVGRQDGQPGGSGGGGTVNTPGKGAGNTPPVSPPQGQPGGQTSPAGNNSGGGGGGAINDGGDAPDGPPNPGGVGGVGGNGTTSSITASPVAYAGGGGGGGGGDPPTGTNPGGAGGSGGGGAGGATGQGGNDGTANVGGGGGAGGSNPGKAGAAGGSGIVVIRYKFQ